MVKMITAEPMPTLHIPLDGFALATCSTDGCEQKTPIWDDPEAQKGRKPLCLACQVSRSFERIAKGFGVPADLIY